MNDSIEHVCKILLKKMTGRFVLRCFKSFVIKICMTPGLVPIIVLITKRSVSKHVVSLHFTLTGGKRRPDPYDDRWPHYFINF